MPGDQKRGVATERQALTLAFTRFGWRAVESAAEELGETLEEFLGDGCGFLVREVDERRVRFADIDMRSRPGQERTIELVVPARIWARITEIASERGVALPPWEEGLDGHLEEVL